MKEFESREKWLVLAMLWMVCFLNYADRQSISSIFPLLEKEFGFTKAELGLLGSTFMAVYALASPVAGFAGDRFSRKRLVVGGCLLWSLMTGLTGFCGGFWQFVTIRSLMALGESVYFPSATSLLSDYHGQKSRSTALSFHQSAVYLGTIAGGSLAALLAEHFGWRWGFYGFGATGLVVVLMMAKWLREPPRGASDLPSSTLPDSEIKNGFFQRFGALATSPGVLLLMLAFACANGVAAIFLLWAPTFLFEKFHLSLTAAGFSAVAAIQLASAVSSPLSGILADWLSIRIKCGRMLVQAAALVLGAFCVVSVGYAPTISLLTVAMICFGLCKGAYDGGIFASLFDLVSPSERASAAGIMNMIGWGGGALGPLAIGLASTYGYGTAMERMSGAIAWSGVAYLAAAALIFTAFRAQRFS
jgi:MFS family permease